LLFAVFTMFLLVLISLVNTKSSQVNRDVQELKEMIKSLNGTYTFETAYPAKQKYMLISLLYSFSGRCPPDWDFFSGSCYFMSTASRPWHRAKDYCESKEAHLLVVNNANEQQYFSSILEPYHYWIGLSDTEEEMEWKWVDGTDYRTTPHFWDDGQPDNWNWGADHTEDCGSFHRYSYGRWNDDRCTTPYRFICEKET
uniref:C-type lectin domain-containing protein n=1 Tax=Latimeria chalumnae TaxID=7897 RepID=H3BEN7_LATCH